MIRPVRRGGVLGARAPPPPPQKMFRSETSKRGMKFRPDMSAKKKVRSAQILQNQNEKDKEKSRKE